MKVEELERLMVTQNPQWQGKEMFSVTNAHVRSQFAPLRKELVENRLILAISGPRRIGKSYLVKQLLSDLVISQKAQPFATLYLQFSTSMSEPQIISQIIQLWMRKYLGSDKRGYIFLDEVQFIDYWQDQVKMLYDQYPQLKFVVTGSTSLFYRQKSKESLAGRVVKKPLSGLSFGEYLAFRQLPVTLVAVGDIWQLSPRERIAFIADLPLYQSEFKKYLVRGQFPELALQDNLDSFQYLSNLVDQLINYDVAYLYPQINRTLINQIFRSLSGALANEYSINRLATEFGSARHEVTEYVRILEEIGLFCTCLNGYFRRLRAKLSGSKKIYSLNTNLALAVNGFDQSYFNDSRVFGQYVENYVFMRLWQRYGSVEYYRDRGREVDFVTSHTVFEVKAGKIDDLYSYRQISQKLHKPLILITESIFEVSPPIVSVPWYIL